MTLTLSSASSGVLLELVVLVSVCMAWSCQVDERNLSMTTAGAMSGGSAAVDSNDGIPAAAGEGGGAGVADVGGSSGLAGAGAGAGAASGGSPSSAGASHSGGTGGVANTARGGSAGSSGSEGQMCGDIDQDSVDDCSETLLQNSRFDHDTGYWIAETLSTQAWDARNARAGTGSGSLLISNVAPIDPAPGSFMVGSHQCVQVNAGASYQVAARVLVPGGQKDGEAAINVQVFGSDGCAGSFLEADTISPADSATDAWRVLEGQVIAPPGARSMWLRLVVSKPFSQATFDALFDDVLVRQR